MTDPDITKPYYRIARAEAQARAAADSRWRMISHTRAVLSDAIYLIDLGDYARARKALKSFRDVGLGQAGARELDNSSCMPAAVKRGEMAAGD